jgi:hypothetical protein
MTSLLSRINASLPSCDQNFLSPHKDVSTVFGAISVSQMQSTLRADLRFELHWPVFLG